MSSCLKRRLRAIALREWGVMPSVFDQAVTRREVLLRDVLDLVALVARDPISGLGIISYLSPGAQKRLQAKRDNDTNARTFAMILARVQPKTDAERAYIAALKEQFK